MGWHEFIKRGIISIFQIGLSLLMVLQAKLLTLGFTEIIQIMSSTMDNSLEDLPSKSIILYSRSLQIHQFDLTNRSIDISKLSALPLTKRLAEYSTQFLSKAFFVPSSFINCSSAVSSHLSSSVDFSSSSDTSHSPLQNTNRRAPSNSSYSHPHFSSSFSYSPFSSLSNSSTTCVTTIPALSKASLLSLPTSTTITTSITTSSSSTTTTSIITSITTSITTIIITTTTAITATISTTTTTTTSY